MTCSLSLLDDSEEEGSSDFLSRRWKWFFIVLKVSAAVFLAWNILGIQTELNVAGCRFAVEQVVNGG